MARPMLFGLRTRVRASTMVACTGVASTSSRRRYAAKGSDHPEDRLILALSLALAKGPNGAAEMMRAQTPAALDLGHTEALDALVAEGGPLAGMAAYDAAHLRALSPPDGADAAPYLKDVAARFRKAESLLVDAAQKKTAAQRAAEVDAIVTSAK